MSLNLEQKQAVVAEVSAQVAQAQTIVLAEYRGLPVGDMTELRKKARESGVYFRVLKNTLARRAVAETPFKALADQMIGPLAYGISSDPVAAAKLLHEFSKSNERLVIKGGAMPNVLMSANGSRGARQDAQPSGVAGDSAGNHAGAGRHICPYPQRGAEQVRACARSRARPERKAGGVSSRSSDRTRRTNRTYCFY